MIGNLLPGFTAPFPILGDFESIATVVVGSGGASEINFTSIPSGFQHLQIRGIMRNNDAANASTLIQLNGDTANNYSNHGLSANGSSVISYAVTNTDSSAIAISAISTYGSNTFGAAIWDLLEYKNTNIYKTMRSLNGADNNGSGTIRFTSGSWRNTNAVTSILIKPAVGSFVTNTTFALYGIKG